MGYGRANYETVLSPARQHRLRLPIDIPPRIRYNARMELAPYSADILLDLIHRDGFSTGEARAFDSRCGLVWVLDASKDGQRWVVHAQSRFDAAVELMIMLGWDLDG